MLDNNIMPSMIIALNLSPLRVRTDFPHAFYPPQAACMVSTLWFLLISQGQYHLWILSPCPFSWLLLIFEHFYFHIDFCFMRLASSLFSHFIVEFLLFHTDILSCILIIVCSLSCKLLSCVFLHFHLIILRYRLDTIFECTFSSTSLVQQIFAIIFMQHAESYVLWITLKSCSP